MKHTCLKQLLDDAAQAIREQDGTADEIIGDDIPDRIRALPKSKPYKGTYVVHPKVTSQELETKDKRMSDNVTIEAIYYSETGNISNGVTVFIGEN